jgi:hypothetical protein
MESFDEGTFRCKVDVNLVVELNGRLREAIPQARNARGCPSPLICRCVDLSQPKPFISVNELERWLAEGIRYVPPSRRATGIPTGA